MWDSTIFARFKDLEGDQMTSDGTEGHSEISGSEIPLFKLTYFLSIQIYFFSFICT